MLTCRYFALSDAGAPFTLWPNHLKAGLYHSFPFIMKKSGAKSSSGRGNHNGDGRAEDPTCSVCMSDEFYEDEQGGMICVACGTQSQDFLAEGFDEDDLAVYGGGTGNIVTLKNASGKGLNSVEESKTKKVDLVPDILEALKLYQFVLQMVFDACLTVSNKSSSSANDQDLNATNAIYRNTLRSVWMDYLNRWNSDHTLEPQYQQCNPCSSQNDKRARFRSVRKCSIGYGFTRSAKYQCKCKDAGSPLGHPLFPSKSLILGFVYLTYRVMRCDVLVSDIVRWCEAGSVPYLNLWECIPQKWRDTVKVDMKWFYDTTNKRVLLTPSSILFHACSIAQVIRLDPASHNPVGSLIVIADTPIPSKHKAELPPLNAPLVAHKIITSLGLPPIVWENYVKITQLCTGGTALKHANMQEQHHEIYIMSVIITAIKCCPNWTEWSLVNDHSIGAQCMGTKHSINDTPITLPEHLQDISTLTRAELPELLAQIRRINQLHSLHTDTYKTQFLYNNAVFTALGGDAEKINKGEGQYTTGPDDRNHRPTQYSQHSQSQYSQSQYSQYSQSSYQSATNNMQTTRSLHTTEVPHFHHTTNTDTTLAMNNVVLYGDSMMTEDLSLKERRLLNFMNGIEPNIRGKKGENANQKAAFMAYTRYDSDRTSLHHLPYVALLERCSKYLYVNAQLLHNLVTDLEKQIVNLAFTGTVNVSSSLSTRNKRKKHDLHNALRTNAADSITLEAISNTNKHLSKKEKLMQKYRIKYEQLLPEAHKQGLETLLRNNKRKHSANSQNADTDGYSSEDSRESYHSINNTTNDNKPGTNQATTIVQPLVFDPFGDFAEIEGMFGSSNVIHRKDAPVAKRAKKARMTPTTTINESAADTTLLPTGTTTTTTAAMAVNTPKSSSYVDSYDSTGASGYDTDTNDDKLNRTPPGSPRPLEFDLLHAYATTQAGERTPPISEITYSRTPFSTVRPTYHAVSTANKLPEAHIFHTGGASRAMKQPKKRTDTPYVAAMEALDRLVSAQDSASESDMLSGDDEDHSGNSDDVCMVSRGTPTIKPTQQRKKSNTGKSNIAGVAGGVGGLRGAALFDSPVVNHNPVPTNLINSTAPVSAPAAPASSGMSLLARAIYGNSAISSTPAAVAPGQMVRNETSNVALRPVVALKRPRVQFQN